MNRFTSVAIAAVFVSSGLLQACGQNETATYDAPFDRAVWDANKGVRDKTNARDSMLDTAKELLAVGMTHDEVVAALGEPDSRSDKRFAYVIGPNAGVTYSVQLLVVLFEDGKITEFGRSSSS